MGRWLRNEPLWFFVGTALSAASPLLLLVLEGSEFIRELVVAITLMAIWLSGVAAMRGAYLIGQGLKPKPNRPQEEKLTAAKVWQFIVIFPLTVAVAWGCTSVAFDVPLFTWPPARPLIYVTFPGGFFGVVTLVGGLFGLGRSFWIRRTLNRLR